MWVEVAGGGFPGRIAIPMIHICHQEPFYTLANQKL